ncbi:hypothetical protein ACFV1W_21200 [Kitasatospora sp. NPDC059648]|uniref:hypothetical protein n=1 Tax=Kitasatospora sp. NPDC059648 TaxID=3346894 RepID=UPI003683A1AB
MKDNRPQYAGAAVGVLCVAFVLYVLSELRQSENVRTDTRATDGAKPTSAVTPAATADGAASEPDEPTECQDLESCDFCGRWEARTAYGRGLDLPESWVALEIDRRGAQALYRTYCSEDHMRLDLAGPLPAPEPFRDESWDRAPRTVDDRLAGLALRVGLGLVGGFLLLGCVLAVRFLVGLL